MRWPPTFASPPVQKPAPTHVSNWTVGILVVIVSSVIAAALTLQGSSVALWAQFLGSNAIGFSIWGMIELLHWINRGRIGRITSFVVGIPVGFVLGARLASLFGVPNFVVGWFSDPAGEWRSIAVASLFASSASAFIYVYANAATSRLELEIERRKHAEASRAQAIAELGLLQAQIEPHFLFNTLAHVQSAIDQDPAIGKQVLEHLIRYLRGTLSRSRSAFYSLAEEGNLIESLLTIASIRLGDRLHSQVLIADELQSSMASNRPSTAARSESKRSAPATNCCCGSATPAPVWDRPGRRASVLPMCARASPVCMAIEAA